MSDGDDEGTESWPGSYPPADITASEFEAWVAEIFSAAEGRVDDLRVALHVSVTGADGEYDFDATARYRWVGLEFLVLVEAKRHKNPIKRELVQVLHQKLQSVGAHKAVMISTAPYQRGALDFAKAHGIALVSLTEGRFTILMRSAGKHPALTREEASTWYETPTFVGFCLGPGDSPESTRSTIISSQYPDYVVELLLSLPER